MVLFVIKHYCDRCGEMIEGEVYFITIRADSLNSLNGNDYRQTFESACCNINAHITIPREYCKECKEDIKNYMNKEVIK